MFWMTILRLFEWRILLLEIIWWMTVPWNRPQDHVYPSLFHSIFRSGHVYNDTWKCRRVHRTCLPPHRERKNRGLEPEVVIWSTEVLLVSPRGLEPFLHHSSFAKLLAPSHIRGSWHYSMSHLCMILIWMFSVVAFVMSLFKSGWANFWEWK